MGILTYICKQINNNKMKIVFEDTDLEELITTGYNSKYKKYTRNAKFMKALATAYNYMRLVDVASELRAISLL